MTAEQPHPHPHPDDEYIITDYELTLFATNGFWDRAERIETYKRVMSRPVHQQSEQEIRKKVLAELSKWVNEHSWRNDAESVACVYSYALVQKMGELRRQQGGEP